MAGLLILWWLGRNQPVVSPEADQRLSRAALPEGDEVEVD
jgi:hypothetical protein